MEKDKISVIVPVYKVEQWLEECVNSIRGQTYRNLEIILVDDGSPDRCPEMCDRFAMQDERIRVIHKENGGVSSARNVGIEASTGQYITFVDSDDYVDKAYIIRLYQNLKGCSMSECGTVCFDDNGVQSLRKDTPAILEYETYMTETNLRGFLSYAIVCSKLYAKELFTDIRFPIGVANGEDEATAFRLIYKAKRVSRIYDGLYYYRQREDGASRNAISDKRIADMTLQYDSKISFFQEVGNNDLVAFFTAKKALAFIGIYHKAEKKEYKELCYKVVKETFCFVWKKKNVPIKYRLYIGAFLLTRL